MATKLTTDTWLMRPVSLQHDCITPCRKCTKCGEIKCLDEFRLRRDSIYPYCTDCHNKYIREYHKTTEFRKWDKSYRSGPNWRLKANQYMRTHRAKKKAA